MRSKLKSHTKEMRAISYHKADRGVAEKTLQEFAPHDENIFKLFLKSDLSRLFEAA